MANSGTVTAGSAALASQYNNLRDDVLNVSTGHTHTGASEDGKKVEGTAIASTGATNGQVLTANGSGGASFAASGGPTLSAIYGTAAFATATNNGGSALRYQDPGRGVNYMTTTGAGTVVVAIGSAENGLTGGHRITTYTTGSTAILAGGTVWANVAAGTAAAITSGQGFATASSQGFLMQEFSQTSNSLTITMRKFTNALVNSWNTQVFTGTVAAAGLGFAPYGLLGPFGAAYSNASKNAGKWAPGPGIWYGGDQRIPEYFVTAGTQQQVSMRIINDASGSVYSASFGSVSGSGNRSMILAYVFVPSSTAATDGTIHAWGVNNASARYVSYAVGSASISAIATADFTYTGAQSADIANTYYFPVVGRISEAIWLESASKVMVVSQNGITFTDRTMGTVLHNSNLRQGLSTSAIGVPGMGNLSTGGFDPVTGYAVRSGQLTVIPSYDGMAAPFSEFLALPSGYTSLWTICGAGSATFIIGSASTGGTTFRWDIAGIAKVQLDASSTANRLMTIEGGNFDREGGLIAVGGGGSGSDMTGGSRTFGPVSFLASGTSPVTAYIAPFAYTSSAYTLSVGTPNANQTIGGTVTLKATKVTLA
jgi:hypothetical protein